MLELESKQTRYPLSTVIPRKEWDYDDLLCWYQRRVVDLPVASARRKIARVVALQTILLWRLSDFFVLIHFRRTYMALFEKKRKEKDRIFGSIITVPSVNHSFSFPFPNTEYQRCTPFLYIQFYLCVAIFPPSLPRMCRVITNYTMCPARWRRALRSERCAQASLCS